MQIKHNHYFILINDPESKMITWKCNICNLEISFSRGILVSTS